MNRRHFLAMAAISGNVPATLSAAASVPERNVDLDRIVREPVLKLDSVKEAVLVESIELLRSGTTYLLRTRSKQGVEAITFPNQLKIGQLAAFLLKNVIPVVIGKDARDWEQISWEIYRHASNYKMQGIALWVCVAAVEMGLLELIAQTARRPLAEFFGPVVRRDVPVYFASGNRGNSPEAELEHLQKLVAGSGVKAIKFRLGGRMSRNADSPPQRTEKLIPLVRKNFGPEMTLYGDANSSYDPEQAIRIGQMMQEQGYGFFEEPCEFDDLWGTKQVADTLSIPVAGGEQEFSLHRWKWTIASRGVDIVQPDLHYGGGFVRAVQVARMAEAVGLTVVPHMSGGGLGFLEVIHFASFVPNCGPYMEFKGNSQLPISCATSSLKCTNGQVRCPTGVGFGVNIDPAFVKAGKTIQL